MTRIVTEVGFPPAAHLPTSSFQVTLTSTAGPPAGSCATIGGRAAGGAGGRQCSRARSAELRTVRARGHRGARTRPSWRARSAGGARSAGAHQPPLLRRTGRTSRHFIFPVRLVGPAGLSYTKSCEKRDSATGRILFCATFEEV